MVQFSPLLKMSVDSSDYDTTFVKDYEGPPVTLDDIKRNLGVSPVKFADKKRTKVWIDNPVLTDVSQVVQTDLKTILGNNPDVSGLSLLLDDTALEDIKERIAVQDFIAPSQYVDIFDVQDFMNQATNSFKQLPASLRKAYNNDVAKLVSALERPNSASAAPLLEFLGISPQQVSASAKAADDNASTDKKVTETAAPVSDDKQ